MGNSSQEQIIDRDSVDMTDWMSEYPVGTIITTRCYGGPGDEYKVVSRDEWGGNFELDACYLPVKLIKTKTAHLSVLDSFDGFLACHVDSVVSRPITVNLRYEGVMRDLLIVDEAIAFPWIPTPEEIAGPNWDNSLKPQPKFGWWGNAEA